ncbi:class I SAM-dependent methyltransferase [Flavobacterium sp. DGU11]|uniref:Class I SAM-dependent methyltransferase n=1 Tax=Flavobacterium arundinis TaxID=3139143 RepID=A0ABU9I1W7_9FLAO
MQHEYYKEYYDLERSHWWFVARERIITNYIKKLISTGKLKANPKILNVGCGPGRSSEYLSDFGKVVSIEYDKFCCEFASEKTGLEIIHGSITELPFEDKMFDLVCAFDVIEHVEDHQKAVHEMKRVAVDDGVLLITVPAFMDLWSHHDVINHHFRRYKMKQIDGLFQNGEKGRNLYYTYFNSFLFPPVYFFRKLSNMMGSGKKRKGSGSDFEAFNPGLINRILFKIMASESTFVNGGIRFPFGVSILYCWKKEI